MLTKEVCANIVELIDICTARGAFRGEELLGVGSIRQIVANEAKKSDEEKDQAKEDKSGAE